MNGHKQMLIFQVLLPLRFCRCVFEKLRFRHAQHKNTLWNDRVAPYLEHCKVRRCRPSQHGAWCRQSSFCWRWKDFKKKQIKWALSVHIILTCFLHRKCQIDMLTLISVIKLSCKGERHCCLSSSATHRYVCPPFFTSPTSRTFQQNKTNLFIASRFFFKKKD